MTPAQSERLSHIPAAYAGLFERIYRGSKSKAERIKAKCLDCCGYQRLEVANCTATVCPLWPIRPYRPKTHQDARLGEYPLATGHLAKDKASDSQTTAPP